MRRTSNQLEEKRSQQTDSATENAKDHGQEVTDPNGFWSRQHVLAAVFLAGTALLLYGCFVLTRPFLPALAWALVFAVLAHPIHGWISRHIRRGPLAAGLSVLIVAITLATPAYFVIRTILNQATAGLDSLQSVPIQEKVDAFLKEHSQFAGIVDWLESQANLDGSTEQITGSIGKWFTKLIGGSASGAVNLLISLFLLFYFLRDRVSVISMIRSLLPLSKRESDRVFGRVYDTVFATIYGTLAVAAVQGALGGLMFWWLGLPAPLLWGALMGLLAIIPVLGAFVIWIPAAIYLATQGDWGKAIILTVWGTVVIGLIDNLLYPILVGTRLRLHTVPVFIAVVGGLFVFGPSGIVVGPVILALTDAAIDVWRCRTADGNSAADTC